VVLANWVAAFYGDVQASAEELSQHVTPAVKPALTMLSERLQSVAWDKASIAAVIKEVLAATGLKMPQLAMPVRVLVMGTAQTPSLDAVLALSHREMVLSRLAKA
jgi:glutamyl-tRNA synthetase